MWVTADLARKPVEGVTDLRRAFESRKAQISKSETWAFSELGEG
jgi:hypothetical protein